MLNGYQIIDVDSHAIEPAEMWEKYLEPAFKHFAPPLDLGQIPHKISTAYRREAAKQMMQNHPLSVLNGFDPESHVRGMKQMGIDISFIYPTSGLWLMGVDTMTPQLMGAFTRAYNHWLYDFCSYNPQTLRGVGAINLHDPTEMVSQLERISAWGWKAVFLYPNPIKGRLLSHSVYEPFWTKCEELEIAIALHAATHSRLPTTGVDRFHTEFAMHACSHPMEQMMALLALIEGGVLERHPKLKVGFLESGCGWLPYWLWRLDEEYKNLHWEVKDNVKMKPSNYFRRQCFIAIEPSEPCIAQVIEYVGDEVLLFYSDYPHLEHTMDVTEDVVALQDQLSRETVKKILWDNPVRFYGLDGLAEGNSSQRS